MYSIYEWFINGNQYNDTRNIKLITYFYCAKEFTEQPTCYCDMPFSFYSKSYNTYKIRPIQTQIILITKAKAFMHIHIFSGWSNCILSK